MQEFAESFRHIVRFDENALSVASSSFQSKSYDAKTVIFRTGDYVSQIHFLVEGIGRYFYTDATGKERNKALIPPGGGFASVSCLAFGAPSPFSTQTITSCKTLSIEYEKLLRLADKNSQWNLFVRRFYENLVYRKEKREAELLMLSAQQRYACFLDEFQQHEAVPLHHVASYLGITDVSLSRIRKEMNLT